MTLEHHEQIALVITSAVILMWIFLQLRKSLGEDDYNRGYNHCMVLYTREKKSIDDLQLMYEEYPFDDDTFVEFDNGFKAAINELKTKYRDEHYA